ncbi:putative baseplate assembly protein [Thalassococcus sp. BH17M4-6]|uniref:putative baseplate assembly protein n=1 Tax=Thalassococcus sp. BH17M4-6 TaxID=3413148 RepID=UPI003BBF2494
MTLPVPNLDARRFQDLMDEARARIPTYTPEWTDFNPSDPGTTLVELHAWLTETLLYQVNRLPDKAYINFLNLLGTKPKPARAAHAELTFKFAKLDKPGDPLTLLVPRRAQVGVDDPNLAEPLTFETDETLRGINAAVASIFLKSAAGTQLVGTYNSDEAALELPGAFRPFGDADAAAGYEMRIGLLLRPHRDDKQNYMLDRFPEGELNLMALTPQVFERAASGEVIEGPFGTACPFPWEVEDGGETLVWEAYVGTDPGSDFDTPAQWVRVNLRGDQTGGLARSGHVYLDIPPGLPAVDFNSLSRTVWDEMGLVKPPQDKAELIDDLENGQLIAADLDVDIWKDTMGVVDPPLQDPEDLIDAINATPALNLAGVPADVWTELGYSEAPVRYGVVWLRARLVQALDVPPEVSGLYLNTVAATAAQTRSTEVLGTSAGRPNQTFKLKRAPVLINAATGAPDVTIELEDTARQRTVWERGEDFIGATRDTKRYLFDPITGTVTFGDGVNGMIPVAGTRIIATGYRVGGGRIGNVAAGTITKLKTALPKVDSVRNLRAASGGSDAETLDEARLRAPKTLRTRDRAVAAEDFADLARETPGVDLKSAFALPLTRLESGDDPAVPPTQVPDSPGAVTVVVLPVNPGPTPQPTEAQLRTICAWLNARRLITTELYVTGPNYVRIDQLSAQITARADADLKAVQDAANAALQRFFHPLIGGRITDPVQTEGPGWPIGGDVYLGDVFDLLLGLDGVDRVPDLKIALETAPNDNCADVLEVQPGTLVHLPPEVIALDVRYGRAT